MPATKGAKLSPREQEILTLIASGMKDEAIAGRLGISISTVKNYCGQVYTKVGAVSRANAVSIAYQNGLLK